MGAVRTVWRAVATLATMANKPTKRTVPGSRPAAGATGRTTPKGGAARTSRSSRKVKGDTHQGATKRSTASETRSKASESDDGGASKYSSRYTPPARDASQMPSPLWVPILMFTLLGLGMLIIILNYVTLFGDASNWRLILGLGFILAGIMTATQYR